MKKMIWIFLLSVALFNTKGICSAMILSQDIESFKYGENATTYINVAEIFSFPLRTFESEVFSNNRQLVLGNIQLKDINNITVTFSEITAENPLVVLAFWASWCKPCMEEMSAINDKIDQWKEKAGFIFVAVSVDDARSGAKVKSLVNGKGWGFKVLKDSNQELKRYFGINNIPCTLILKNSKEVARHSGYTPGGEDQLFKVISKFNE